MMLRALLADMRLVRLTGTEAEISCAPHARAVAQNKLADLSKLLSELSGTPITARLTDAEHEPASRSAAADGADEEASTPPDVDHPIVKKALEVFNGRIIDVKPVRRKPTDGSGEI
ncbi:MAG: hypothetical protein AAFR96_09975 [Planctomycetota bacterium]